jgi:hypothetical protein
MKAHPKTGRTIREEAEHLADAQNQIALTWDRSHVADAIERAILRYAAPRYTKNGTAQPRITKEPCERCMGSGSKNDAIACGDCGGRGFIERGPDPRVNEFIAWFCDEYNSHSLGAEYLVKNGQDHAIVKNLLRQFSVKQIQECATILLDVRTDDKFIQESDRGIGILSVKFNWLNQRRAAFLAKQMRPR